MENLMLIILVLFVAAVVYLADRAVYWDEQKFFSQVQRAEALCESLAMRKEDMLLERRILESEAAKIFTLYDMTKEIARKLHEHEAFEVFKAKLLENVMFKDCQLLEAGSPRIKEIEKSEDHFIFSLQGENKQLGCLVFEGVPDGEKDKALILSHQFALALRRVRLTQEIERLAITDSLTGLHTRRYFMERFEEELKRSKLRNIHLSFIMVDVDHFKDINDKYGHLVGDHVLKEVGRIIRESVREIDIVGRYGGEEFCVVLPDTDREGVRFAGERIRKAVESTAIKAYDITLNITLSAGLTTFPEDGQAAQELMDKSDWALYRAKKNGRNCTCAFGIFSKD